MAIPVLVFTPGNHVTFSASTNPCGSTQSHSSVVSSRIQLQMLICTLNTPEVTSPVPRAFVLPRSHWNVFEPRRRSKNQPIFHFRNHFLSWRKKHNRNTPPMNLDQMMIPRHIANKISSKKNWTWIVRVILGGFPPTINRSAPFSSFFCFVFPVEFSVVAGRRLDEEKSQSWTDQQQETSIFGTNNFTKVD